MTNVTPKLFAVKKDGKIVYHDPTLYWQRLNRFKDGQELEVTIVRKKKLRTSGKPGEETNFNGYYWGVEVKMIADDFGYFEKEEIDRLHEWLQIKVGNVIRMPDGTVVTAGTSHMDGGQFADFTTRVRMFAAIPGNVCEHGMYIPEPHEVVITQ